LIYKAFFSRQFVDEWSAWSIVVNLNLSKTMH
jgi:hypothetical protein